MVEEEKEEGPLRRAASCAAESDQLMNLVHCQGDAPYGSPRIRSSHTGCATPSATTLRVSPDTRARGYSALFPRCIILTTKLSVTIAARPDGSGSIARTHEHRHPRPLMSAGPDDELAYLALKMRELGPLDPWSMMTRTIIHSLCTGLRRTGALGPGAAEGGRPDERPQVRAIMSFHK